MAAWRLRRPAVTRRRARSLIVAAILGLTLASGLTGASGAPWNPPPPGLPTLPNGAGQVFAKAGGLVASDKSDTTVRQAIQIQIAGDLQTSEVVNHQTVNTLATWIFPISATGDPNPYGDFLPVQIHTLAFGNLPVSLTLFVTEVHDAHNLPKPLYLEEKYTSTDPPIAIEDPVVTGQVNIRLDDVTIDQIPLEVGSACQTSEPASIEAHSKYWPSLSVRPPPPDPPAVPYQFSVFTGGELLGSVNIPSFTGCRNGSEDLSPLFTNALSGAENVVTITSTGIGGSVAQCSDPNNTTPYCGPLDPLPLPTNPVHH